MHGLQRAAHVHHSDEPAVPGIGDRGARAGPGGVRADEVLGGEDLHGPPHHRRGAHAVGADDVFAPVGAEQEPQAVGLAQDLSRTLPPQHTSLGVRDDHDVLGHVRDRKQTFAQHRQDVPER